MLNEWNVKNLRRLVSDYDGLTHLIAESKQRLVSLHPGRLTKEEREALYKVDELLSGKEKYVKSTGQSIQNRGLEQIKAMLSRNLQRALSEWEIWDRWLIIVPGPGPSISARFILLYYPRFVPICDDCGAALIKPSERVRIFDTLKDHAGYEGDECPDLEQVKWLRRMWERYPDEYEKAVEAVEGGDAGKAAYVGDDKGFVCSRCSKKAKGEGLVQYRIEEKDFPNISSWWHYLGMHVKDGKVPRRQKGQMSDWSNEGRQVCYQFGEQAIKRKGSLYRLYYDERRAYREKTHPEASDKRKHEMARHETAKLFAAHFWLVAREIDGKPITKPWAIEHGGHSKLIVPYYWNGGEPLNGSNP